MYQHHELFASVDNEVIAAALNACGLQRQTQYTDDEAEKLNEFCTLSQQGKTFDEITEIFHLNDMELHHMNPHEVTRSDLNQSEVTQATQSQQQQSPESEQSEQSEQARQEQELQPGDSVQPALVMSFSEMRSWVAEALNTPVSPIEAGKLIEAAGLPDQEEYNEVEVERFLSACDLYKNQHQTISQIAAHFQSDTEPKSADDSSNSANGKSSSKDAQLKDAARGVAEQIEKSATTAKQGVAHLIDTVVGLDAKGISDHVNQSYLKQVAIELESGRHDIEVFYAELESWTKAQIEGKRQAHSLEATWEWAADSLPPSSTKPPLLPEVSNNGTTDE